MAQSGPYGNFFAMPHQGAGGNPAAQFNPIHPNYLAHYHASVQNAQKNMMLAS